MYIGQYEVSIQNILIAAVILLVVLFLLKTAKNIIYFLLALGAILLISYLIVGDIDFLLDYFVKARNEVERGL
jgi:membrane protein required for beta-lactamase induction